MWRNCKPLKVYPGKKLLCLASVKCPYSLCILRAFCLFSSSFLMITIFFWVWIVSIKAPCIFLTSLASFELRVHFQCSLYSGQDLVQKSVFTRYLFVAIMFFLGCMFTNVLSPVAFTLLSNLPNSNSHPDYCEGSIFQILSFIDLWYLTSS